MINKTTTAMISAIGIVMSIKIELRKDHANEGIGPAGLGVISLARSAKPLLVLSAFVGFMQTRHLQLSQFGDVDKRRNLADLAPSRSVVIGTCSRSLAQPRDCHEAANEFADEQRGRNQQNERNRRAAVDSTGEHQRDWQRSARDGNHDRKGGPREPSLSIRLNGNPVNEDDASYAANSGRKAHPRPPYATSCMPGC